MWGRCRPSVREQLRLDRSQTHRLRLAPSCVSLLGLIEQRAVAIPATGAGIAGLLCALASLASLIRVGEHRGDNLMILGLLAVTFTAQLITGLRKAGQPAAPAAQHTSAIITVICFPQRDRAVVGADRRPADSGSQAESMHYCATRDRAPAFPEPRAPPRRSRTPPTRPRVNPFTSPRTGASTELTEQNHQSSEERPGSPRRSNRRNASANDLETRRRFHAFSLRLRALLGGIR